MNRVIGFKGKIVQMLIIVSNHFVGLNDLALPKTMAAKGGTKLAIIVGHCSSSSLGFLLGTAHGQFLKFL